MRKEERVEIRGKGVEKEKSEGGNVVKGNRRRVDK